MTDNEQKQYQYEKYVNLVSKYTDKQLVKEIKSYRKHFQSHDQFYLWTSLNPDDFNINDKFLILREELSKRGLKEDDR